jgi:hypothetical protein
LPGLTLVPGNDQALGVLGHLGVGGTSGGGPGVSLGLAIRFHLSPLEAHCRIVAE